MRIYNPNLLSRRTSGNGEPGHYEVFKSRDIESMNGRGLGEGFGMIYEDRPYGLGAGIGPGIGVGHRHATVRAYTSSRQPKLVITTANESKQ
jgi:hypothetical protein